MANTTFNTRIKLKYDTLANWTSSDPVLLQGELALVEIPAANNAATTAPTVLMKVGNGTGKFSELTYTSSLAGDVYAWAKASSKPSYSASEITGLSDYISGEIEDTDTQYKIALSEDGTKVQLFSKKLGDADFGATAVSELTLPTDTLVSGDTNGTVKFNGTEVAVKGLGSAAYTDSTAYDVAGAATTAETNAKAYADGLANNYDAAGAANDVQTAIENKIGTVTEGKTIVQMIADAQTAATYDDTALTNRVSANETAINKLNAGATEEGSVAYQIAQIVNDNNNGTIDTLNEIASWIVNDTTGAAKMASDISALETKVGDSSISDQIDAKITALDLSNAYDAKGAATTAETNAKAYADGLASNYDAAGAAATAESNAISTAASDAASKYVAKEDGKGLSTNDFTDTLKTKLDGIAEGAEANVIENIEVNGISGTVENKVAKVSVSLDAIAANTAENYVIFDCGSASTLTD